jgi:hypothetical protein
MVPRIIYWTHSMLIREMTARAWGNRNKKLITRLEVAQRDFLVGMRQEDSAAMNEANHAVYGVIEDGSRSPGLVFLLKTTLRFFPDFSDDLAGWPEIGSHWHAGLIDQFTGGSREGAAEVTQWSVAEAAKLVLGSFWRRDD